MIKDSFKFSPSSLANLASTCGVENKGYFPYEFIPNHLDVNYGPGEMPLKEDFACHDEQILSDPKFKTWYNETKIKGYGNVRKHMIQYCVQDVRILTLVLIELSKKICQFVVDFRFIFSDLPTLAKLSQYFWLKVNYEEDLNKSDIRLIAQPANYIYEPTFTSWLNAVILTSLMITDSLLHYNPILNCFITKNNPSTVYVIMDCTHYCCPHVEKYETTYAYNTHIKMSIIKNTMEELITLLQSCTIKKLKLFMIVKQKR